MTPVPLLLALSLAGGVPTAPAPSEFLRLNDALAAAEAQGAPGMMDRRGSMGTESTTGGFGSRWLPGQTLMQGYLGDAEATARVLRDGNEPDLAPQELSAPPSRYCSSASGAV